MVKIFRVGRVTSSLWPQRCWHKNVKYKYLKIVLSTWVNKLSYCTLYHWYCFTAESSLLHINAIPTGHAGSVLRDLETSVASCGNNSDSENICTYAMDIQQVNPIHRHPSIHVLTCWPTNKCNLKVCLVLQCDVLWACRLSIFAVKGVVQPQNDVFFLFINALDTWG